MRQERPVKLQVVTDPEDVTMEKLLQRILPCFLLCGTDGIKSAQIDDRHLSRHPYCQSDHLVCQWIYTRRVHVQAHPLCRREPMAQGMHLLYRLLGPLQR